MTIMINKDTVLFGSFSKQAGNNGCKFFNGKFKDDNVNAIYKSFSINNIKSALESAKTLGFGGFAVSMPFKTEIIDLLDRLDEHVSNIGAVNTVVNVNGKLIGYNTDYLAIMEILKTNNVTNLYIIGTGGFSKAAQYACQILNIPYKIIDRTNFGNLDFIKDSTILNCTPVENISVDDSNKFIDGIPTTPTGQWIANIQAEHQYKLYKNIL